jgi:hypothetical protein
MNCKCCKKSIPLLQAVSSQIGYLCRECHAYLPSVVKVAADSPACSMLIDYERKIDRDRFLPSGVLGTLVLDNLHGLFALSPLTKDGDLKQKNNIFDVRDLSDISIQCIHIHSTGSNLYCDIEFTAELRVPAVTIRSIIQPKVKCAYTRINDRQVEWQEPGTVSMFRSMIKELIIHAYDKTVPMLQSFEALDVLERIKAESLFMVDDDYTEEELKASRNALMKAFHPDDSPFDISYSQRINAAYHLLKETKKG